MSLDARTFTPVRQAAAQRRTLVVLSVAQVVGGLGVGASVSVGAILALQLSGSEAWSGMAATSTTLGAAAAAVPLARLADRAGRRAALATGWGTATLGALGAVTAAVMSSFPLFLAALILMGAGNAANLQSRFAATDLAPESGRARALSLVVWATTVGAVAGPNLTRPGAAVARAVAIPALAGPFLFSAAAGVLAAVVLAIALRPDPLLTARRQVGWLTSSAPDQAGSAHPWTTAATSRAAPAVPATTDITNTPIDSRALAIVAASPHALAALISLVTGHAVMIAVMAMTPVHMNGHGASLALIGLTISLHIAGMYAFSPVVGWIADKHGRVTTMLTGQALLVAATLTTALAGRSTIAIAAGLIALGLGWSFSTVGASTLLAEAVPPSSRTKVQGAADLLMNLAGAGAGAGAGLLADLIGYAGLSIVALLAVAPAAVIVLATRQAADRAAASSGVSSS